MPVRNPRQHDVWTAGDAYEPFVGRWSRRAAREFIAWLALAANSRWRGGGSYWNSPRGTSAQMYRRWRARGSRPRH